MRQRLISTRTSSLPFEGSDAYRVLTTASVLTVASTSDWNASTGGKSCEPAVGPVPFERRGDGLREV